MWRGSQPCARGFPNSIPAETINRFCSSGLQSVAHAAHSIMAGQADAIIAGGTESMSMVPMVGFKFSPNPAMALEYPDAYLSMGLTAENVSDKYGISREDQDAFSFRSHKLANAAVENGTFDAEIAPLAVEVIEPGSKGQTKTRSYSFYRDEGPRADTTLEALARLRPVFKDGGTVTAGNSSQMSDGAAALLVMSLAKAETLGLEPLARFISYGVGGVPPEIMGIGPIKAVPKALALAGLSLGDIGLIELNEAFRSPSRGSDPPARVQPGNCKRQWGRDRTGTSVRLYRRQADNPAALRDEAQGRKVWAGNHVYWRGYGRCGCF